MIMAYLWHNVHKKFKIKFFFKMTTVKICLSSILSSQNQVFIIDLLVTDGLNSNFLKGQCSKQTMPKLWEVGSYSIFMACVYLIIYLLPFQPFLLLIFTISLYCFRLILSSGINASMPTFVAMLQLHFLSILIRVNSQQRSPR